MATVQSNENWKKENTVQMTIRLMKKTEGDIIDTLEHGGVSKRARLLHLVRLGMEYEKLQKEGTAPTQVSAPTAASIDPETERFARLGREHKKLMDAGWNFVSKETLDEVREAKALYLKNKKEPEPEPQNEIKDAVSGLIERMKRSRELRYQELSEPVFAGNATPDQLYEFGRFMRETKPETFNGEYVDIGQGLTLWPIEEYFTTYLGDKCKTGRILGYKLKTMEQVEQEKAEKEAEEAKKNDAGNPTEIAIRK